MVLLKVDGLKLWPVKVPHNQRVSCADPPSLLLHRTGFRRTLRYRVCWSRSTEGSTEILRPGFSVDFPAPDLLFPPHLQEIRDPLYTRDQLLPGCSPSPLARL